MKPPKFSVKSLTEVGTELADGLEIPHDLRVPRRLSGVGGDRRDAAEQDWGGDGPRVIVIFEQGTVTGRESGIQTRLGKDTRTEVPATSDEEEVLYFRLQNRLNLTIGSVFI